MKVLVKQQVLVVGDNRCRTVFQKSRDRKSLDYMQNRLDRIWSRFMSCVMLP